MPLRISFPCGVIFRTFRIVKMNCGAMRQRAIRAPGDFPPSSNGPRDDAAADVSKRMGSSGRVRAETLAYAGLGVATVGWAIGFIAGKLALTAMSPLAVAAWRYAVAATILLPFALR